MYPSKTSTKPMNVPFDEATRKTAENLRTNIFFYCKNMLGVKLEEMTGESLFTERRPSFDLVSSSYQNLKRLLLVEATDRWNSPVNKNNTKSLPTEIDIVPVTSTEKKEVEEAEEEKVSERNARISSMCGTIYDVMYEKIGFSNDTCCEIASERCQEMLIRYMKSKGFVPLDRKDVVMMVSACLHLASNYEDDGTHGEQCITLERRMRWEDYKKRFPQRWEIQKEIIGGSPADGIFIRNTSPWISDFVLLGDDVDEIKKMDSSSFREHKLNRKAIIKSQVKSVCNALDYNFSYIVPMEFAMAFLACMENVFAGVIRLLPLYNLLYKNEPLKNREKNIVGVTCRVRDPWKALSYAVRVAHFASHVDFADKNIPNSVVGLVGLSVFLDWAIKAPSPSNTDWFDKTEFHGKVHKLLSGSKVDNRATRIGCISLVLNEIRKEHAKELASIEDSNKALESNTHPLLVPSLKKDESMEGEMTPFYAAYFLPAKKPMPVITGTKRKSTMDCDSKKIESSSPSNDTHKKQRMNLITDEPLDLSPITSMSEKDVPVKSAFDMVPGSVSVKHFFETFDSALFSGKLVGEEVKPIYTDGVCNFQNFCTPPIPEPIKGVSPVSEQLPPSQPSMGDSTVRRRIRFSIVRDPKKGYLRVIKA